MSDDAEQQDDGPSNDVQRLAREYLDLWEHQIKGLAGDEALARTMAQTMEIMNAGAANVSAMMQAAGKGGGNAHDSGGDDPRGRAGPASAGTSSGDPEPDVRELALRLGELERRLDRLEGLLEPSGKLASGKSKGR